MCTVIDTPEGISYARLATIKGALKLESVGMKGRAGPIRPKIAAELGLKPRDSYPVFIAEVQRRMDVMLADAQAET